jgi:hypothetical protein
MLGSAFVRIVLEPLSTLSALGYAFPRRVICSGSGGR